MPDTLQSVESSIAQQRIVSQDNYVSERPFIINYLR